MPQEKYTIVGSDDHHYGPEDEETIRRWIREGKANSKTMILREGASTWVKLTSLPQFEELVDESTEEPTEAPTLPRTPKTLGIANIILGGGGLLCGCGFTIFALVTGLALGVVEFGAGLFGVDNLTGSSGWMKTYFILFGIAFTSCSGLLLIGGVGLMNYKAWGRKLSLIVAVIGCLVAAIDVYLTINNLKPIMDNLSEIIVMPFMWIAFSTVKLIQVAYPIVLLILLNTSKVKSSCR